MDNQSYAIGVNDVVELSVARCMNCIRKGRLKSWGIWTISALISVALGAIALRPFRLDPEIYYTLLVMVSIIALAIASYIETLLNAPMHIRTQGDDKLLLAFPNPKYRPTQQNQNPSIIEQDSAGAVFIMLPDRIRKGKQTCQEFEMKGMDGISLSEIQKRVRNGSRFVIYWYCMSLGF
ncbi:MAG: hypothetical protein FJ267_02445, partial [Planctomycetes bacterium]|nr:hypothetical protein [Planctomycetota bacterium]